MDASEAKALQLGDVVAQASWGTDTQIVDRINSTDFPDDPIAFFVGGGFCRTSRLHKVDQNGR